MIMRMRMSSALSRTARWAVVSSHGHTKAIKRNAAAAAAAAAVVDVVRPFHGSSSTSFSGEELPYHIVVGLPALSPTMESGSLAEWYVSEGDSFSAGDVLAKIETDKATIDFEAQDDGNVAKLLLQAGEANDLPIGTPIMITVEEPEHVAAFRNYVYKGETAPAATVASTAASASSLPAPAPAAAATRQAPEPVVATSLPSLSPPPSPRPTPAPASMPPPRPAPAVGVAFAVAWGAGALTKSPLAKLLAKEHQAYISKYGSTGQKPLL